MFIEIVKLLIIIAVPIWLLKAEHHSLLLMWIGATLGTEILDTHLLATLRPSNVVGFACLPIVLERANHVFSTKVGRLIGINLLLLVLLGLVYGLIFPWPDTSGMRLITQLAQGRSIIYLLHVIADLGIAVYIAHQVQESANISKLFYGLLIGTTISSLGLIFQLVTHIDLFNLLVPDARDLSNIGRLRGVNGEPRVSGQLCTVGILLLMGLRGVKWRYRMSLLTIHFIGLTLTAATSGLLTLIFGLILLVLTSQLGRKMAIGLTAALILSGYVIQSGVVSPLNPYMSALNQNMTVRYKHIESKSSKDVGQKIAGKLEVFDASAFRFLYHNPEYLLLGTGPGLVSLPASDYVPSGIEGEIFGNRIDSVPSMGFFLILADNGVIGLVLWFTTSLLCYQSIRQIARFIGVEKSREASSFFVVFSGLYLLQAKPIWYLFLGIGLGAAITLQRTSRQMIISMLRNMRESHLRRQIILLYLGASIAGKLKRPANP